VKPDLDRIQGESSPRGVHLFQWVKNVDATVATPPANQPYGIREFGVSDIDGVAVVFGQDIEQR